MIIDALRIFTTEGNGFFHIDAHLTGWNTEKEYCDTNYDSKNRVLDKNHMFIHSQGSNDNVGQGLYAIGVRFKPYDIELYNVESLAKACKSLQSKLAKYDKEFGYTENYGDYLSRVAKALNIKTFIIKNSSNKEITCNIESARWHVRDLEQKWKDRYKETRQLSAVEG